MIRATQKCLFALMGGSVLAVAVSTTSAGAAATAAPTADGAPLALVYRGPASCDGCSEAVAALLRSSGWNFDVQYVGPLESDHITSTTLARAALYAQPGGDGSVDSAYAALKDKTSVIRNYVGSGGRYIGFCMGAYLEGTPGFDLLPGNIDSYISSSGATVRTTKETIVGVDWRGVRRYMYFQDGTRFILNSGAPATVLAKYPNHAKAAIVVPFGQGKVAGVGPHPEADSSWYGALVDPDGLDADLGHDLIDTLMAP